MQKTGWVFNKSTFYPPGVHTSSTEHAFLGVALSQKDMDYLMFPRQESKEHPCLKRRNQAVKLETKQFQERYVLRNKSN
jgi:hypothetical protein